MTPTRQLTVRPASEAYVPQIFRLLAFYAVKQIVLPRTEADIRYYLGNFTVCADGNDIVGCMAVRDFGNRLFEVRSLAVKPEFQGRGIGRMLLTAAVERLKENFERFKLFALTYQSGFFIASGFSKVEKAMFPEKIWSDCMLCAKREHCDEEAVLFEYNADLS